MSSFGFEQDTQFEENDVLTLKCIRQNTYKVVSTFYLVKRDFIVGKTYTKIKLDFLKKQVNV